MRFSYSDDQEALRQGARRFLEAHAPSARVRRAADGDGFDAELWRRASAELGWPALTIAEAHGGAGLGAVELSALLEETGRALAPIPLFSTVCLGATPIALGGTPAQQAAHLPRIAEGTVATLALAEADGRWDTTAVHARAHATASGFRLDGRKSMVPDGHLADLFLVAARTGAALELFLVEKDAPGLERRLLPGLDRTRRFAELTLTAVPAERLGHAGTGARTLARTLDRAAIALGAEQVGAAERCLDLAVDYAKTRQQFGRAIGSFQAVKHRLADVFVAVESARSALYYASFAASVDDPELPVLAAVCKATCSEAFFRAAADSIQVHGGIGFTSEHDAHLYFKRARASQALFGSPADRLERVAAHLEL